MRIAHRDFGLEATASRPQLHAMPFGAEVCRDGVRFRLWAPGCDRVGLAIAGQPAIAMEPTGNGWHEVVTDRAEAGSRYLFALPDGSHVPDPASRHQPDDVHGPSVVVDPRSFAWTDEQWRPGAWADAVIYELHVGTFTPEGTFAAAIAKLDHLAALGVTTIEIMPVADFPGGRNWGYDGVYLFAPDASYGTPDDMRRLVDAAHARGLSVMLDVVYNHFGPDGNYLATYAPPIVTDRHKTPWGNAVNYDGAGSETVREFAIQNALYWLDEFHIDGLRLDAVHQIMDESEEVLIEELARRVHARSGGRAIALVLENEENEAARLERLGTAPRQYTAQWNDDVHHALHTAATGEASGYYADYHGDTAKLGRALAEGFAFQGQFMPFRGSPRGEPSAHLPPEAFVSFMQNHDQIGNRAFGQRLVETAPAPAVRAVTAIVLLLPQIPMLFMGEEWGTTKPFPYFCDFAGELGEAVRQGRRDEFKHDPAHADGGGPAIPDPQAEATFRSAKLDWSETARDDHGATLAWYKRILATRRRRVAPLIAHLSTGGAHVVVADAAVSVIWRTPQGDELRLDANLKAIPQSGFSPREGNLVWGEGQVAASSLGPWSVCWSRTGD